MVAIATDVLMALMRPMALSLRRRAQTQGDMMSLSDGKVFPKTVAGMISRGTLKVFGPSADDLL